MIMIDVRVPTKDVQAIRSNIGPESVEKCRDVQNEQFEPIFGKKLRVLKPFFQTPLYFLDTDCSIFKTHYKEYTLT
jgi:hypothetical protein